MMMMMMTQITQVAQIDKPKINERQKSQGCALKQDPLGLGSLMKVGQSSGPLVLLENQFDTKTTTTTTIIKMVVNMFTN